MDVDGNKKESINDNKKPFAKNTVTANSVTLPPKTTATVTLQYATPQDSFLCITKGSYSLYSLRDYNCNDSNANPYGGNLSSDAYYYASDTPVYKRTITLTNNTSSDGYYTLVFRTTDTNGDSRKNWYGFWATVEYKTILSGDRQYRRSSRYSPGIPTRRGYAFAGWSTDPEETVEGAILDSSSTLSDSWRQYCNDTNDYSRCDASIELYALWKKIDAVPVRFVTNNPERVNLATTEIEWNASVSGLNLRVENNAIQYYVSSNGEYVTIGTFSYSSTTNSFLKVGLEFLPSQYISQSNTLALQEGEYLTVNINYSEAEVTTMQELDRMSCSAAPVGTSAQLIDSRDGKKYWITKLNDGNCWMTQNLDIALSTSGTTVDSHTIYTEATWNRSQNSQVNNYYDGGDYYMQNGMTAVSTEGLADDAEEWHYHRGSIYNAHVAVYLCPPNWELGNYQMLFKSYGINQPDAYAYSFRDQTLFNAPIYITADIDGSISRADVEASGSSSAGDSSVFWSSAYVQPNLTTPMSSYVYAPFSYNYNATTGLFTGVSNYQYAPRQGGFVRCMR